jgi:hypothetical protein
LTIEFEVLYEDYARWEGVVRVKEDLGVWIKRDRLLIRRGTAEVEAFPAKARHLVKALGEAAVGLMDQER